MKTPANPKRKLIRKIYTRPRLIPGLGSVFDFGGRRGLLCFDVFFHVLLLVLLDIKIPKILLDSVSNFIEGKPPPSLIMIEQEVYSLFYFTKI